MRVEPETWVTDDNAALLTDLYELTMIQAYWRERRFGPAVFSLFVRRLPAERNYLLACGLDDALRYLERLQFDTAGLEYLGSTGQFEPAFLDWLAEFRFTGDVRAVPEGTPVFAEEPILEISARLPEAQIAETFVMNQIHFQTMVASKAARVVHAAAGRTVVDFGLRRLHGTDAGLKAARAFHIAGVHATSNVLAGMLYGIPTAGTMAHSYVQSHDREMDAFRDFSLGYPGTILLVDTYDTLDGVRRVVQLAGELGDRFAVRGVRLDSGDLDGLAVETRRILDDAGLHDVSIFASGSLDEFTVAALLEAGAPIDGFGVGTRMGVSADAPYLDIAYKLAEYGGKGRLKLSAGKRILPGSKQVFRVEQDGVAVRDIIAGDEEDQPGRPLLVEVMAGGKRLDAGRVDLDRARSVAEREIARLPARIRAIEAADVPYPVTVSADLERALEELARSAGE